MLCDGGVVGQLTIISYGWLNIRMKDYLKLKQLLMRPTVKKDSEQSVEDILRGLVMKYVSYWPLFLVLLILSRPVAWLYLRYKVPVYESKATILIKDEKKGFDDSKMLEALDMFGSKKIVENEIEILKSQTLAQQVVKNLHLYAPITEEGRFANHSAYSFSPVQIMAMYPDSLQTISKVYFSYNKQKQQVVFNHTAYPLGQWFNSPYGVLKFVANPKYPETATPRPLFFSLISVEDAANGLIGSLNIFAANKLSTVINLSLKDEVPERGADVLNALIMAYNRAAIEDKNILAGNTLSFVEDRLQYVVHELDSVEAQLQHFKTQNKIVDINMQGKLFLQNVGANDQKIGDISMQLAVLDQVENYVLGKGSRGGIVPSTLGITDPVLSNLLDKLYNTELEYEKVKKIAPENNPILISLTDQINKIKPGILENIMSQRKGLIAGKNDLANTNNKYSSLLQTIPEKERELLEISRQQAIKNNIYTFLLQKREEAALSYASMVADSRVVDKAQTSKNPVTPNRSLIYMVSLAAAFALGIAFISIKDLINPNIDSRTEVERYTDVPILGELVKSHSKEPVVVSDSDRSFIAEQFRQLRTSLGYLGINSRKKKILITSAVSAEGKSFVTANLGMSLALANKKVVLVELDLRRPALAAMFGISGLEGLSEYLIGAKEIEAIIKRTDGNKNLFVIPAGAIPNNPSELLLNGKVQELFTYLDGVFDYIIIDTSPVNPVTDAYILSPLCDATLYIIRQGITPRSFVQKLDEYSSVRNLKNMAIVYNGAKGKGFGKYGYGYNYGYSYVEDRKSLVKKKGISKTV